VLVSLVLRCVFVILYVIDKIAVIVETKSQTAKETVSTES
jgi:hypothetical protein